MTYIGFPSTVRQRPTKGMPGDKASLNPVVYTDRNCIAGDEAVTVGNFVWRDPSDPDPADAHGAGVCTALSTGSAGALPLGIVENTLSFVNDDVRGAGTLTVPKGAALSTVRRGDLYVVASTAAAKGQKLFAVLADGSIMTGAAGAALAGTVETPWVVTGGGAAGELITVSNWEV